MKKLLLLLFLTLAGCAHQSATTPSTPLAEVSMPPAAESIVIPTFYYPMANYTDRLTFKKFGQAVNDRFCCYHVGDDLEVTEEERSKELPVYAMTDGKVVYRQRVDGYGGLLILQHEIDGRSIQSLYGHVDLSQTRAQLGDHIRAGTLISYLGDHESTQTDGERKHLHFSIYEGTKVKIPGYVQTPDKTTDWINPSDFLRDQQAANPQQRLAIPSTWIRHDVRDTNAGFRFSLLLPPAWRLMAVPEIDSIAISDADSQTLIFLRSFDAASFLTLSTVTIHKKYLRTVNGYEAVEYDIEKKPDAANFPSQPDWRNRRHSVIDIRETAGFSRFYVFGLNPKLEKNTAALIVSSIEFAR